MSEYTVYDFEESLFVADLDKSLVIEVVQAWGWSPEGYGSWEGGFVLKLRDGQYAYVSGWCDTTGWGCQDGAEITYADSLDGLGLSDGEDWDLYPTDLNRLVKNSNWTDDSV